MNPQKLIDTKVAACVGQNPHVWEACKLWCCTCIEHDGFTCRACGRCVDRERDTLLYEAILSLFPEEDIDD